MSLKQLGRCRSSQSHGRIPVEESGKVHAYSEQLGQGWGRSPEAQKGYVEHFCSFFEDENSNVVAEQDGEQYKPADCGALFYLTHLSFPEFDMPWAEMKMEKGNDTSKKNYIKVTVEGLHAKGTHTGAPYTIMPGKLPTVPASGIYCFNDEQTLVFTMNKETGKVKKYEVIAMGSMTGFIGFYTRCGGDLSQLQVP